MKFRKIILSLLLLIMFMTFTFVDVDAVANNKQYWDDNNQYNYTTNIVEDKDLGGGVRFVHDNGFTTRGGTNYDQNVYIMFQKSNASSGMKVATWAIYKDNHDVTGAFTRSPLSEIAKDYEKNHPGWKVIGGINADQYFQYYGTDLQASGADRFVNQPYYAMMADGENWFTIDAMGRSGVNVTGFKNDGSDNPIVYRGGTSSAFTLSLYDENHNYLGDFPINDLNPSSKTNGEYTYVYGLYDSNRSSNQLDCSKSIDCSSNNSLYIVSKADKVWVSNSTSYSWYKGNQAQNSFFGKGIIDKVENNFKLDANSFAIETTNTALLTLLKEGCYVVCQYKMDSEMQQCESAIGWHTLQRVNGVDQNVGNSYNSRGYPRSVFGITKNGEIALITGNGTSKSGLYAQEINAVCKAYDIETAFQMDGGGSVTMIMRDEKGEFITVNKPSDGSDRHIFNGLFFVVKDVDAEVEVIEKTENSLKLAAEIKDYGVDKKVTKTYIQLTGKTKNGKSFETKSELIDGVATFNNLGSYLTYTYKVVFEVEGETKEYKSLFSGSATTAKVAPTIKKVSIDANDGVFKAYISLLDGDKAITGYIKISFDKGKTYHNIQNNMATLNDLDVDMTNNIYIKYYYDLLDGNGEKCIEIKDFATTYGAVVFIDSIKYNIDKMVSDILEN